MFRPVCRVAVLWPLQHARRRMLAFAVLTATMNSGTGGGLTRITNVTWAAGAAWAH
jgi:hypothetical protein